jgi:hypothetical protein
MGQGQDEEISKNLRVRFFPFSEMTPRRRYSDGSTLFFLVSTPRKKFSSTTEKISSIAQKKSKIFAT